MFANRYPICLYFGLLASLIPQHSLSQGNTSAAELQWRTADTTTLEALSMPSYCGGYYERPLINHEGDAFLEADQAKFKLGDKIQLDGNVVLQNEAQQVTADSAEYNETERQLSLNGNIRLTSENLIITSDYADIGVSEESGKFNNTSYLLIDQHLRGSADSIVRSGETSLTINQGFYTRCSPDDNTWHISTKELALNIGEGYGVAKGATVNLWNKPVIYIPYLPFPIGETRKSGLLWPSVSTAANSSGLDIAVPYYWNIAPQADATITPRLIGSRAVGVETETRYLHRFSEAKLSASYISDSESQDARWLFSATEQGQIGDHVFHSIDLNRVSDNLFFEDFNLVSLDVRNQTHLRQTGHISYWDDYQRAAINILQYQTLEPSVRTPYRAVPNLQWQLLEKDSHGRLAVTALTDFSHFENTDPNRAEGQRLFYQLGLSLPFNWQAGFVKSRVHFRGIEYYAQDEQADVGNQNMVYSLDTGLRFERWQDGHRITLEPRLYYLYAGDVDRQLNPIFDTTLATDTVARRFSESQYIGYDRLDNANDISLGLTSRWFNKEAKEVFSAAIAQTFLVSDKTTDLDELRTSETAASDFVTSLYWRGLKNVNVEAHIVADKNLGSVQNGNARATYNGDDGLLLGITHVYNNNETLLEKRHQTEISAAVPLNDQWTLYGQLHYDYNNSQQVQQTYGFAREDCCWRLRFVAQESLRASGEVGQTETSFHLQFELKGLGGTGSAAVKVLEDTIYGFTDEND